MTDKELLARYAKTGSDAAFEEIVTRHTDMVYAVCLRRLGHVSDAEDAAQATFLVLMKKAGHLSRETILQGWLFRTAGFVARDFKRQRTRRARHEREASMKTTRKQDEPIQVGLQASLDAALEALPHRQQDAIILRHLCDFSVNETAAKLGCPASTASTLIQRGLEKLRGSFKRKGVIASSAIILTCLSQNAAIAAPAGLATSIYSACIGKAALAPIVTNSAGGAIKMIAVAKMKMVALVAVASVTVVAGGITVTNHFQNDPVPEKMPPPVVIPAAAPPTAQEPTPTRPANLVPIRVEDHSGTARSAWPITGGIPFPKGKVKNLKQLTLGDKPIQTRVLSRWSDGSIKWALLDYQVDLGANAKTVLPLSLATKPLTPKPGNKVSTTDYSIVVDTGKIKFTVNKQSFSFIQEAWVDLNGNGKYETSELVIKPGTGQDQFYDLQMKNPSRPSVGYSARNQKTGKTHVVKNSAPTVPGGSLWMRKEGGGTEKQIRAIAGGYTAKVVEDGAYRTVIEIKGSFGKGESANEYSIWIHAYKGKALLRVQHNFVFKGDPQTTNIRRMGLRLPLNFSQAPTFRAAGLTSPIALRSTDTGYLFNTGPADVFHLEHLGFNLNWEVRVGAAQKNGTEKTGGWIDVTGEKFGVTTIIRDMAKLYPKELSYDNKVKSLTAWLWPDHGNTVMDLRASGWQDGMQGISFSNDVYYHFHAPAKTAQSKSIAAAVNDPPQPYATPEWYSYRGTKAAGMLMPFDDKQFPKTEAFLATGNAFLLRSQREFGWYGMLNYGDLMWAYTFNEQGKDLKYLGTWGMAERGDDYAGWRRGNTMISYRLFMQYLRTGNTFYWRSADAHLKCVRDVLIKHYNQKKPKWAGMGRRHSGYWGAGPANDQHGGVAMDGYGTNWLGHYLHWNLTGDWRTYDVMKEIRQSWKDWGDTVVYGPGHSAWLGLRMYAGVPGFSGAKQEAQKFRSHNLAKITQASDFWRDCIGFLGAGMALQDNPDPQLKNAILAWWEADKHGRDQYGIYWHRDAISAVYWAAEGKPAIRKAVYDELVKEGSIDAWSGTRINAVSRIYKRYGINGLNRTIKMLPLANAFAPGYYRAKDDIMQIQWDEPLGMAVIDHYRKTKR